MKDRLLKNRYFSSVLTSFLSFIVNSGSSLAYSVVLARFFGKEEYGQFILASSIVSILQIPNGFKVFRVLGREILNKSISISHALVLSCVVYTATASVLYFFLIFASMYVFSFDKSLLVLVAIFGLSLFFQLSEAFKQVCISTFRTGLVLRIDIATSSLLLFMLLLSARHSSSILYASASITASAGLRLLAYLFLLRRHFCFDKSFITIKSNMQYILSKCRDLALVSFPYVLTVGLVTINLKADAIIVGFMLPVSDLPSYQVASKVMLLMQASMMPYESVLSRKNILQGADESSLNESIRKVYTISFYVCSMFAFLMLFASPPLIDFLYGAEFGSAVLPLRIICFVPAFTSLMRGQSQINLVTSENRGLVFRQVVAVICNLLLDFLLVPRLGINGAAIATLASVVISVCSTFFVDKRIFNIARSIVLKPDFSFATSLWTRS